MRSRITVFLACALAFALMLYDQTAGHTPYLLGMAILGARFRALPGATVEANATPPAGNSEEAIWHQIFDTQSFVSGTTTRLVFFQAANADRTLSNMDQGGSLPRPQKLQLYNLCLDVLSVIPVTTSATIDGVLNDLALLIFGANQRPTWTLNISQKAYGPYSLTTLGGTGGPTGFGFSSDGAEIIQFAKNDPSGGWNYFGRLTIPEQVNFSVELNWAATATMTADKRVRFSMFGVQNRRVL
jgi:hypothetical protein